MKTAFGDNIGLMLQLYLHKKVTMAHEKAIVDVVKKVLLKRQSEIVSGVVTKPVVIRVPHVSQVVADLEVPGYEMKFRLSMVSGGGAKCEGRGTMAISTRFELSAAENEPIAKRARTNAKSKKEPAKQWKTIAACLWSYGNGEVFTWGPTLEFFEVCKEWRRQHLGTFFYEHCEELLLAPFQAWACSVSAGANKGVSAGQGGLGVDVSVCHCIDPAGAGKFFMQCGFHDADGMMEELAKTVFWHAKEWSDVCPAHWQEPPHVKRQKLLLQKKRQEEQAKWFLKMDEERKNAINKKITTLLPKYNAKKKVKFEKHEVQSPGMSCTGCGAAFGAGGGWATEVYYADGGNIKQGAKKTGSRSAKESGTKFCAECMSHEASLAEAGSMDALMREAAAALQL